MIKKIMVVAVYLAVISLPAFANVYYMSPAGNDAASGTKSSPFLTIQKAQEAVAASDTVYVRGGTYSMNESGISTSEGIWAYVTHITKSGMPGKRINYWAYPGEKPVFDFTNVKPANKRISAFAVSASWIHFKGLQVTLKHWRCGGIPCSVCPESLLIKDTKVHCLFCCSALFVCLNRS